MSESQAAAVEIPALGVGTIFTQTFAILFRRIGWFFLLALVPALAMEMLDILIADLVDFANVNSDNAFVAMMIYAALSMLVGAIGGSFATALIAQAAYDAKLGRPTRIGTYIGRTLRGFVPIFVLAIALSIVNALGTLALIVPGIWLMGLWSAVIPAIVIDRCGFDAVRRSHALTRGYRWPAAGALLLVWLIVLLISGALMVPIMAAFGLFASQALAGDYQIYATIGYALIGTIQLALISIATALIYARLREIKEGAPIENLAEVFD